MRISIETLGCRTNQAESLEMEAALKHVGNSIVAISELPDICIINTCSVTAKADQQSRQLIRKALRNNTKVIVTGCYADLHADIIKEIGDSIEIVKNIDKCHIINRLTNHNSTDICISGQCARKRPIIKVQDGCNFSCSYCSIPMARGRSRSLPLREILHKINKYEEAGYKEIVLTGIHLGTYGLDCIPKESLSFLLSNILTCTSIPRIRLSSLEINDVTNDVLDIMEDPKICRHLHIPLQNGDDSILRRMNRNYDTRLFADQLEMISQKFPGIAIGTDIITGFPGESDHNFLNTCRFIESLPLAYVHVFPYSSRPGTRAAAFENHVPEQVKKERVRILNNIAESIKRCYIESNIDNVLQIIVENMTFQGYFGTSANYIKVLLTGDYDLSEETLVNIRVTGYENQHASGIPLI
ncbi:MAG: tRNA (N(6)-L-threonylcarbamoyladenosine(37)-C(2))-methylthiotransferase MtaB [Nitrospirae bacterium]|nr:tRNA (N(6)-L-threonylcarbamoyladenosine(37)-C(2))-methylthiotransferase MtaB [Nitrospirota bacterium]